MADHNIFILRKELFTNCTVFFQLVSIKFKSFSNLKILIQTIVPIPINSDTTVLLQRIYVFLSSQTTLL